MPYTALYRKLRPQLFQDVVGQEHIVRTLLNQLQTSRVSHAYLFCGTRGTGKTSTAKILARSLNCQNPADGEPCNQCPACEDILAQRSMNVIEIDAASNNGVDNIRDIREEVKYPPTEGKYKVYIIDEVHMLSTGAFNALLKTLEEPPEHVVFILATTDPHKIPATILSRCQRYDFKRISAADQVKTIEDYVSAEKVSINMDAIRYIASISDGAMRDALSLLDQCMSFYYEEEITLQKVLTLTGAVDRQVLYDLTDCLYHHNGTGCLEIIDRLVMDGRDINQFVSDLVSHFRNLLVATTVDGITSVLDFSIENIEKLRSQGKRIEWETLMSYIRSFSQLAGQLKYASNGRVLLEVACIKVCNPSVDEHYDTLFSRIKKLEDEIKLSQNARTVVSAISQSASVSVSTVASDPFLEKPKTTPSMVKRKKAVPDDLKAIQSGWSDWVKQFDNPLRTMLSMSRAEFLDGSTLCVITKDPSSLMLLKEREHIIRAKGEETLQSDFMILFMTESEYEMKNAGTPGVADDMDMTKEWESKIRMDITYES